MNFAINNVRALQIFQILRQGAAILISILLAKSQLSTDEIGIFEMLTFIGTTVSFFWIAGLNQGLLSFFPKQNANHQAQLITNVCFLFCGISVVVTILLFFFEKSISNGFVGQNELPYYQIYIGYLLFFMPSFLIDYFYLLKNRPIRIVQFGGIAFSLQILVVVFPIFVGWGLRWSIYGLLGLGILRFFWLIVLVIQWGIFSWNGKMMQHFLRLAFPLILYTLLSGFPTVFDSWLVGWFYNDEEIFAIFRYGARELPLALALAGALSAAMIPELVAHQKNGLLEIRHRSLRLYHFLFPLSIVLLLTSHWWFPKVFNANFLESASVFNVFLLIVISRLLFPQSILMALGKTKTIFYISILETLLNVILSIVLVRYFGLVGIAMGTFLAYLFEKIAMVVYLQQKHNIAFTKYTPMKWLALYSVVLLGIYFWVES